VETANIFYIFLFSDDDNPYGSLAGTPPVPNISNNNTIMDNDENLSNVPPSLSVQHISNVSQISHLTQMSGGGNGNLVGTHNINNNNISSNSLVPHSQSAHQLCQPPLTPLSHHQALQQQLQKHFASNNHGK
jgi:hypothetical protein